jgi:hypothetical protein
MNIVPEPPASEANRATRAFIEVLNAENLPGWANRFSEISKMLESGNVHEALHLYTKTKYTGPGSLSDVYAENEAVFNAAWGRCSAALNALEVVKK